MSYLDRLTRQRCSTTGSRTQSDSVLTALRTDALTDSYCEKSEKSEISPPPNPVAAPPLAQSAAPDRLCSITDCEKSEKSEISPPSANLSGWHLITLAWPGDVSVPVPKGRWQREADGTIVATYTRDELACALALAGVPLPDITESTYAINAINAKSPPLEVGRD